MEEDRLVSCGFPLGLLSVRILNVSVKKAGLDRLLVSGEEENL